MWEQFSKGIWQNNYGNLAKVINKTPCKHCRQMGAMIITIINVPKSALAMGFWCNEYHKTSLKKIIFAGSKLARGGKCSYSAQQECEKWQSIASGDSRAMGRRVRCKDQTSGSHNHSEQRGLPAKPAVMSEVWDAIYTSVIVLNRNWSLYEWLR